MGVPPKNTNFKLYSILYNDILLQNYRIWGTVNPRVVQEIKTLLEKKTIGRVFKLEVR